MAKARQPNSSPREDTTFVRHGAGSAGARQVVLVPGSAVPLVAIDLPDRLRGQAREQVAQRRLADRLGLRPEHIAMRPFTPSAKGERSPDVWTRVLTADKGWLDSLRDVPGRAVLPDYLSLPTAEGLWTVQACETDGHPQLMVRFGPQDGLTAQPALALAALRQASSTLSKPKACLVIGAMPAGLDRVTEQPGIPIITDIAALDALGVARPVTLGFGELACDLRKNPMAARARLARRVLPWRWTALAALLAAVVWGGLQWYVLDRTQRQTREITQATNAVVRQTFTANAPVLDVRLQVSRALAQMQAAQGVTPTDTDALDLVHRVSEVLHGGQIVPELIEYRAAEGLRIIAGLPDFAAGDRLAAALRADGLRVELRDSRTEEGESGVRIELAIAPAAPQATQ
ncbi:type II secretion system protein GspL [Primorskyibacter sp. 2E107]|uniref:type II secretion system protein GspL n=1 Tax=Primorskyibacter sp. 2E107 TaxID=3403458 RepID=UPI003AF82AAA